MGATYAPVLGSVDIEHAVDQFTNRVITEWLPAFCNDRRWLGSIPTLNPEGPLKESMPWARSDGHSRRYSAALRRILAMTNDAAKKYNRKSQE